MSFNENLVRARKEKGMNQEDLAAHIGVTRQAVSKWETGESLPDLYKLSDLADVLGVSIDSLCDRQPPAPPEEAAPTVPRRAIPLWKKALAVFAAAALLAASFFAGAYTVRQTETGSGELLPLPDVITVEGIRFGCREGVLTYQFVPSVTGEEYTYSISFLGDSSGLSTYETSCEGGICVGEASLTPGEHYAVSFTVSNGEQSRTALLTADLSLDGYGVSWTGQ